MRGESSVEEPYAQKFRELIRAGAAARDMHDSSGAGKFDCEASRASEAFVEREVGRVAQHSRSLVPTLLAHVGKADKILDVGCGSGGTTVAIALSKLDASEVIGIDANANVLEAARCRAQGYQLGTDRVDFRHLPAGSSLPFESESFDLITCISVLEFVGTHELRQKFLAEFLRVLRPGGHIFLATPTPYSLREYHSKRPLGNFRRRPGFPWSSRPTAVKQMLKGCDFVPLGRYRMSRSSKLRPLAWAAPAVQWAFPWQQFLARKPLTAAGGTINPAQKAAATT